MNRLKNLQAGIDKMNRKQIKAQTLIFEKPSPTAGNRLNMKKIKVKAGKKPKNWAAKDLLLTTADGQWLEITEAQELSDLEPGLSVRFEDGGMLPDGEFILPDALILIIEDGVLKELVFPDPDYSFY